jgi:hypothetical protein
MITPVLFRIVAVCTSTARVRNQAETVALTSLVPTKNEHMVKSNDGATAMQANEFES